MINRLRNRLVAISAISVGVVFAVIFAIACLLSFAQTARMLDGYADIIAQNRGVFPAFDESMRVPGQRPGEPGAITPESQFTTRFFTVMVHEGDVKTANVDFIASVTQEQAIEYADQVLDGGGDRGWVGDYRYLRVADGPGQMLVFVDGQINRAIAWSQLEGLGAVLLAVAILIVVIMALLSKQAVKPVVESYEKQKRFVTDASHELKTPLTLILANLDIVESESGESEWTQDIRTEAEHMSMLVSKLVDLSRMDEGRAEYHLEPVDLSALVSDCVDRFREAADLADLGFAAAIEKGATVNTDQAAARQIVNILLDNALKYCDEGGRIDASLDASRRPVFYVRNSYAAADTFDASRVFERFYRSDDSRAVAEGHGIGLSLAQGIAEALHLKLSARSDAKAGFVEFSLAF